MADYNIKVDMCYQRFDNFKQAIASQLIYSMSSLRLHEQFIFESYANISFAENDIQKMNPIITKQDSFNRTKTNCIIFNMPETKENPGYFNKLFVYNNGCNKDGANWAFVIENLDGTHHYNKFVISYEIDDLYHSLQQVINMINKRPIYKYYSDKTDSIQNYRKNIKNK